MTSTHSHDVLVVGAGPGGLATAISAARHGASVLAVERHPGTAIHPRALGISTRTMELFRTWGIASAVRARSVSTSVESGRGRTLADPGMRSGPLGFPSPREALAVSPTLPAACPQDLLEPLLVEEARAQGAEIRFGAELTSLHVTGRGVRATVRERTTGALRAVRARYVVGADGPRSGVRDALGIAVEHLGTMGHYVQVLFRADLDRSLGGLPHPLYALDHPDAEGLILRFGADRWGYARQWFPDRGESPADFTPAHWTELLRTASGIPGLRPEILDAMPTTLAAEVATAFRAGRGFLVGDAAHRMTPVAARGLNTAIQDGHNLGWKLAWAARGLAGEALLDSYAEEREPVGRRNAERSLRTGEPDPSDGLPGDLGVRYRSAVLPSDAGADRPGYADPAAATGAVGERAPHLWVSDRGRRRSTVDLFDGRLTLLTGPRGRMWHGAARRLVGTGHPITALRAGADLADPDGRLARAYRTGSGGAVLVRPDGVVAWRSPAATADPDTDLTRAVSTTLGHDTLADALAG